jgi:hypothetical protein
VRRAIRWCAAGRGRTGCCWCLVVLAASGWANLGARGSGARARSAASRLGGPDGQAGVLRPPDVSAGSGGDCRSCSAVVLRTRALGAPARQAVKKGKARHRAKPRPRLPDLVVRSVRAAPGSVVVGSKVSINDAVANVGNKAAPRTTERYYVSSSAKLSLAITRSTMPAAALAGLRPPNTKGLRVNGVVYRVLLAQRLVPKLRAGRSSAATRRVVVSSAVRPGSYYVIACAKAVHQARESHTKNDCRTARSRLTVKPVAQGSCFEKAAARRQRWCSIMGSLSSGWVRLLVFVDCGSPGRACGRA